MKQHLIIIALTCLALGTVGCVPLDGDGFGTGDTDLTGEVQGEPFFFESGGADSVGTTWVITLADTPEFACGSFEGPPLEYISISISNVDDAPTTYEAEGNVFFNRFEGGVSDSEAATEGTVTIDEIDTFEQRIIGTVDARNADSEIVGSFDVEICQ